MSRVLLPAHAAPRPRAAHRPPRTHFPAAQYGAAVYISSSAIATFLTDLPANTFSGNTGVNNNGNCYNSGGTITGSCG